MTDWFTKFPAVIEFIIGLGGFMGVVAGAVAIITKIKNKAQELPKTALEKVDRLVELWTVEHADLKNQVLANSNKLANDHIRLNEFDASFKIIYRALWAMLDHFVNTGEGNGNMKQIRDDLQSHIIHK